MAEQGDPEIQNLIAKIHESAYGFDPMKAKEMVAELAEEGDIRLAIFCIAAVAQIRENVTGNSMTMKAILDRFPDLAIDRSGAKGAKGGQGPRDRINMTGVRFAGYWLCHASRHPIAQKLLAKGGSPLTGVPQEKQGEVARINRELAAEVGVVPMAFDAKMTGFAEKVFQFIGANKATSSE
jgi:hypothetical protein